MANRSHSCALQLVRDFSVCDTLHDPRVTCGVGKLLQVAAADSSLWRAQRRQPAGPGIQRGSSLQSGIRYSAYRTFLREGSGACSLEHFLLLCALGSGSALFLWGNASPKFPADLRFALCRGAIGAGEGSF